MSPFRCNDRYVFSYEVKSHVWWFEAGNLIHEGNAKEAEGDGFAIPPRQRSWLLQNCFHGRDLRQMEIEYFSSAYIIIWQVSGRADIDP